MPKSLEAAQTQEYVEESQGAEVSGEDTEIAVRMSIQMLSEGGLQVIEDALNKSQDPAMVVGQFLAQLMGALGEKLAQEINLDPRIFLAKGGWLDEMLDYIEKKLGYPEEFSDQIYAAVLETVKAAAMSPPAPNDVMQGAYEEGEGNLPDQPAQPAPPGQPGIPQAGGYS